MTRLADVLPAVLAVDADNVSAGPIGLLITVLVGITTVLLIRNMSGRLKRLPPEFPDETATRREEDGPAGSA